MSQVYLPNKILYLIRCFFQTVLEQLPKKKNILKSNSYLDYKTHNNEKH